MSSPRLYAIADRGLFEAEADWLDAIRTVARSLPPGGAIQVRAKAEARPVAGWAAAARSAAAQATAFLNGAAADAAAYGFDGVHWPEARIGEATAGLARVGASVHDPDAARRAERAGSTFVQFGPVWDAGSAPKPGVGLAPLRAVVDAVRIPVIAVGGITPERVAAVLDAGASGVAAISAIFAAEDPSAAVRAFVAALGWPGC